MKKLSIEECQRDLLALEAADQLTDNVEQQIARFKSMGTKDLLGQATKMLISGNLSLEALGLPENFFEQLDHLVHLNAVTRRKYRECVQTNLDELSLVQDGEVVDE